MALQLTFLVICLLLLFLLIIKFKVHPFLSIIGTAVLLGLLLGLDPKSITAYIVQGFGGTLGSIGIIIAFGVIIGEMFALSNASTRMAKTFIKIFGKGREEAALLATGFFVSIPIFCDSAFIVLAPIVKSISQITKKSVIGLGVPLAIGLVVTHSVVPPTPGPLGVVGIFGVDLAKFIFWALIIAITMVIPPLIYVKKYLNKKIYQYVDTEGEFVRVDSNKIDSVSENEIVWEDDKKLPSNFASFGTILTPIILILLSTVLKAVSLSNPVIDFLGTPIIAVGIGVIWAMVFLTYKQPKDLILKHCDKGLSAASTIIFVTGAGGALGSLLRNSGLAGEVANYLINFSFPPILLPFLIATLIRFIQGSGTVAMITAATISAPILANTTVNPVFAALSACIGSLFFSYFNDSYFWVVNKTLGINNSKEQIAVWSVTSTIAWGSGFVSLLILNFIFG